MFPTTSEILKKAYSLTKKYFLQILGAGLVVFILSFIGGFLVGVLATVFKSTTKSELPPFVAFIGQLMSWVLNAYVTIGWIRFNLLISKDIRPTLKVFTQVFPYVLKFILTTLVYTIVIGIGYILFIVPGIILSIKYSYVFMLLVDKNLSLKEAFDTSSNMTNGLKWRLAVFGSVLFGINVLGFLLLFVGLFFTVPMTSIATYLVYNTLYERVSKPQAPETSAATSPPANLTG